ncbi:MAG: hypothetical protein KatS3mg032_0237 [Cyclobacteriaceae bacterium]|nr:MAG: hypothetical protein KatS3mg032_0237 [Cyclobacteriaceae bacterium]
MMKWARKKKSCTIKRIGFPVFKEAVIFQNSLFFWEGVQRV